jgi:hypothetical protein
MDMAGSTGLRLQASEPERHDSPAEISRTSLATPGLLSNKKFGGIETGRPIGLSASVLLLKKSHIHVSHGHSHEDVA